MRDEPVVVAEPTRRVSDAPTLEVGPESVDQQSIDDEARTEVATDAVGHDPDVREVRAPADATPGPSDLDVPDFRRRTPGRAALGVLVGAAVVVVAAGFAWKQFASGREQPVAKSAEGAPKRNAPEPAPEPQSPVPVPPPTLPVANEAESPPVPAPEAAVGTSPAKESTAVSVKIKVFPEGAVIFRAGQRLGTGAMDVSVERGVKQRLTALHDGYLPLNFTLDGSRDAVTIRLKRPQKEAAGSDSPFDAPSADSNAVTTPTPTAAPAPAPAVEGASAGPSEPGS